MATVTLPAFNGCAPPENRREEAAQHRCREALSGFLGAAIALVDTSILNCGDVENMEIDEYETLLSAQDFLNRLNS